jgi:hypothetical protein
MEAIAGEDRDSDRGHWNDSEQEYLPTIEGPSNRDCGQYEPRNQLPITNDPR